MSLIYLDKVPGKFWQGIGNDRFEEIAGDLENASSMRRVSGLHNIWHQLEKSSKIPIKLYMVGDSVSVQSCVWPRNDSGTW